MRIISKLALVTIGASALSCSADGYVQERTDKHQEAIYYGDLDTTHPAVVTVFAGGGVCTGTIIEVSGSTAYVLTAAHCLVGNGTSLLPISQVDVALGSNYQNPTGYLNVAQTRVHPLYDGTDGSPNDFGMIRATGASASTPHIPAMTPAQDNLAAGTQLNLIGFGRTESSYNNSTRRYIIKPIDQLVAGWIAFNQNGTSGGTCQGDSGGPAVTVGTERVAGVTSFGTGPTCTEDGYSGRVSTVYDSFIKPFIDGTTGTISCGECDSSATYGNGACVSTIDACWNNSSCTAFANCISGCSDDACWNQCIQSNPTGADLYSAIGTCICNTCDTECANDPMCAAPTCGFAFTDASCDSCSDSACCSQEQACADDATCPSCLSASPPSACSSNAAFNAYLDCLGASCETECGVSTSGCGLTTNDATCDDCFQTACETECVAATDESSVNDLLTCYGPCSDQPCMEACDAQYPAAAAALGALDTCMGAECATECGMGGAGGTGGTGGFSGGTGGGTAGTGGGTAGTGGDAGTGGVGGSAGVAGGAGTAGSAGTAGGTAGTGAGSTATPSSDSSGDSGGCSTSGRKNGGAAGALILFGAALAFLRRRR
jgi:uncharacterized protein (TIGR03382 family)